MSQPVIVHKLDHQGREVWSYTGRTLARGARWWRLEAFFDRENQKVGELELRSGDRFVETFYANRWYNVFAVHDGERLKGFYCNITRPARLEDSGHIYAEDLALDLIVYPDGRWDVMDEDEFTALPLPDWERQQAHQALAELQLLATRREGPFRTLWD